MKRIVLAVIFACFISVMFTGCGKNGTSQREAGSAQQGKKTGGELEVVKVPVNTPLYYLPVSAAKVSSFDKTPDWAPEPNSMAPFDGDMLTRWSSDYEGSERSEERRVGKGGKARWSP